MDYDKKLLEHVDEVIRITDADLDMDIAITDPVKILPLRHTKAIVCSAGAVIDEFTGLDRFRLVFRPRYGPDMSDLESMVANAEIHKARVTTQLYIYGGRACLVALCDGWESIDPKPEERESFDSEISPEEAVIYLLMDMVFEPGRGMYRTPEFEDGKDHVYAMRELLYPLCKDGWDIIVMDQYDVFSLAVYKQDSWDNPGKETE